MGIARSRIDTRVDNLELHLEQRPEVYPFFDQGTNTVSYIVKDPDSNHCAIIDSVLDIDYAAGALNYDKADLMIDAICSHSWVLDWLIETHIHADHLSAAAYIQDRLGGEIGIGAHVTEVQRQFAAVFHEGHEFCCDGRQFDRLFGHRERYAIGRMEAIAIHTPGHTPACMTHIIGDSLFVGDTLFMPDSGTARADFPQGDAGQLYRSITNILSLPDTMRLFICHDYGHSGRDIQWETTVGEQSVSNIHVHRLISEEAFVAMRQQRDRTLSMPRLLLPSIQVNMRAGCMPMSDANTIYLKVPISGWRLLRRETTQTADPD